MEDNMINEANEIGVQVEAELSRMFETGQRVWDIEDIRRTAKKTYDLLFDSYEEGEANGVETSNYSLLEKEDEDMTFTLTKK
jgi:hypothetical protein